MKSVNKSYLLATNFIDSCESGNYNAAKTIWEKDLQKEKIDPRLMLWIAHWSFKYGDTSLFNNSIIKLISENGFTLSDKYYYLSFYKAIRIGNLKSNYFQIFKKENQSFILNNVDKISDIYFLEELYRVDQLHTIGTSKTDSCCVKLTEHLKATDKYIYDNLYNLSVKHKILPNSFDFNFEASEKVTIIIQHLLYDSVNIKNVWEGLLPYYKRAFEEGKMTNDLIYIYDKWLNIHFQYQYYGTIPNIKILDEEGLAERKNFFLIK